MNDHLAPIIDLFERPKWEQLGLPDDNWLTSRGRPDTPLEALMSCAPGDVEEQSQMELLALKEAIGQAFEVLTDEETWVFDAVVIEGLSYRAVARQLNTSKSSIFRTKQRATRKLRMALENHPAVIHQLQRSQRNRTRTIRNGPQ